MSSLNSQESSNDICRLTDKQQAEYRDAYREYISQMSQLEMAGSGAERPHPGHFIQAATSEDKSVGGRPFYLDYFYDEARRGVGVRWGFFGDGVTSVGFAKGAAVCLRAGATSPLLPVCEVV